MNSKKKKGLKKVFASLIFWVNFWAKILPQGQNWSKVGQKSVARLTLEKKKKLFSFLLFAEQGPSSSAFLGIK